MTTDTTAIIAEVHRIYCSLTGTSPNIRLWERDLYEFISAGFTPKDMEQVLVWIIRENGKASDKRYHKSVSLMKLIGDLRYFDSFLCEARASNRNHKPVTAKTRALMDLRPQMCEPNGNGHARHVSELLKVPSNFRQ